MALPSIRAYQYQPGQITNTVGWAADPHRAALLVHDMQNHFIAAFERSEPNQLDTAITRIRSLINRGRELSIHMYYTAQPPRQDPADRGLLTDFWGAGLQHDTAADIDKNLLPHPEDTVLTKWRYSAFARSDFAHRLEASGRDQLIITGIYAHIGCMATALEAFMGDLQVFFVADALADFTLEDHAMACEFVAKNCGFVTTTEELIAHLSSRQGQLA